LRNDGTPRLAKEPLLLALTLVALCLEGRPLQAADQFTPVILSPHVPKTQPVLGTDGKYHLVYELACTNTKPVTATLQKIEVLNDRVPSEIITAYTGDTLLAQLRTLSNVAASTPEIEFNGTRLFLIHLTFASRAAVPRRLLHHFEILGAASPSDSTPTAVSYTAAPLTPAAPALVLGPPLAGKGWVAVNGCCEADGVHRRSAQPVNGRLVFAQRFAIDWMRLDDHGRFVHADPADVHSYAAYGADVLAVADGTVVETLNTLDDQLPPDLPDPKTITLENVEGNHVVLDLGHGVFAFYAHLQKGSVTVKPGDRVTRGRVLGRLGNSGNSSAPHLHFHVMDGPSVLGSDGLPYVIDRFRLAGQIPAAQFAAAEGVTGDWSQGLFPKPSPRRRQFPLDLTIIDFPH
jgi:hypothetical protein